MIPARFEEPEQCPPVNNSSAKPSSIETSSEEFTVLDQRWIDNLNLLRPHIEQTGYISYANVTDANELRRLKNFVKEQRTQHKNL